LKTWEAVTTDEQIRFMIGHSDIAPYGMYSDLHAEKITPQEARDRCIAGAKATIESRNLRRWIDHILNRLAFERELLGEVSRFEGDLTAVILQAFAREHGAEKPAARVIDDGFWIIESPVPLPLHIGNGQSWAELGDDEWRDLMQASGYEVPAAKPRRASSKPAPAPLINLTEEQAAQLQRIWNMRGNCKIIGGRRQTFKPRDVCAVTQAQYSANSKGDYSALSTIEIDAEGRRIVGRWVAHVWTLSGEAVARIRIKRVGGQLYGPDAVCRITDKPAKALPINLDALEREAAREVEALEQQDEAA